MDLILASNQSLWNKLNNDIKIRQNSGHYSGHDKHAVIVHSTLAHLEETRGYDNGSTDWERLFKLVQPVTIGKNGNIS